MKKFLSHSVIILGFALSSNVAIAADQKANYDVKFIDAVIEHHNQGIEIFKLGAKNANSVKVKTTAQTYLAKDQKDLKNLQALRAKVKNSKSSNDESAPTVADINIQALALKSGKEFDEAFLEDAIDQSQDGVSIAEDAVENSKNQAVKSKARAIISESTQRVAELKKISEELQ